MPSALPLRKLLGGLDALSVHGPLDTAVAALAYDARRVVPGAVFFAVPRGGSDDGPAIPRAIERGAAAIVCEEPGFIPYRATRIRVANCRRAMAAAASAFYGHPSRRLRVVAITGGPGRELVAGLVYQLLSAAGIPTGWAGSRGCRVGERLLPPLPLEPEALDVQELFAVMERAGCRTAVVELSPEAIQHGTLAATEIAATFTIALAEGSSSAPGRRVPIGRWSPPRTHERPGRGSGGGWWLADVPGDGPGAFTLRLERDFEVPWVVAGRCRRFTPSSTLLEARTPQGKFSCRLPLAGSDHARVGLAAAMIALVRGVPFAVVARGLARVVPVPGSIEPVRSGRGFQVLVDAADSATELAAVLQAVRSFTLGRVLLLVGCGYRHTAGERATLGELAARGADHVILTSNNPGWESPDHIATQVAAGYQRARGVLPRIVSDRAQAIRELLREARRGDCVLLTGKGHRTAQELAGCVQPFDDRLQARAALAAIDPAVETVEAAVS